MEEIIGAVHQRRDSFDLTRRPSLDVEERSTCTSSVNCGRRSDGYLLSTGAGQGEVSLTEVVSERVEGLFLYSSSLQLPVFLCPLLLPSADRPILYPRP